jgi:hypothetical protein
MTKIDLDSYFLHLDQDIKDWKIMLDVVHGNIQQSNLRIARRTLQNLIEQLTTLKEVIEC